jgi:DNA adenine methylase
MILSDTSRALISMWQFFQDNPNFELPDVITEDEYNTVKKVRDPHDWRTAYYGFGMSFGSKFFGGYARNKKGTNYCSNLKRSINLKHIKFVCCDFKELKIPKNSVVYCDPPYENRTKCHNFDNFNTEEFWQWCRYRVKLNNTLLVTGFVAPSDFVILHNWGDTVVRHHSGKPPDDTQELLVCHESQRKLFKFVS